MKRGFIICLMVFGLTYAIDDNIGSETKDIDSKSAVPNINFRFYDKNKRGATKITNTDSPSFNHLTASNAVGNSVGNTAGFKPPATTSNPPPFRYLYNQQQYYQPNPYLTYVQLPQAAQIAAQYSIQANPITHFLHTPNQIQYVAAPTVAQVPQIKFQGFSNEYATANAANTAATDSSASSQSSQYVTQTQQTAATPSQVYVPPAPPVGSTSSAAVAQVKQIPFYPGYQAPSQPVFYTQQPLLTYFPQAQAANFIYQQPNANYLLKQHQLANIYAANRFGIYAQAPNAQLTYLVPMVVPQPEQDSTTTTSNLKPSDKTASNTQQSSSSNSFSYGAKA